ncbi:c-type cytochrome domain-containing protein [Muriicola sp. Z0-33]|uniref:c-type cytochrome domain-containing protein n=1 Tax=Muriicola sp. Z0-33 TaxID=2816957 RepID=UPI002237A501|nr:c-type cytochrome domain-containing protein [Muriicola sp. Z0-33]MCW5518012.1 hypothetical protein [Muriicola sp. Z0-33]
MTTTSRKRWVDYLILGLLIFLCFCLLFESHISPPALISWLGHWHPVVLHFPIVLVIIAVVLLLSGKKVSYVLLSISCLAALITAISGFFLGLGSDEKGDLLFWHQLLGAAVAIGMSIWYWLANNGYAKSTVTKGLGLVLLLMIGFTGHYGGMITHGQNFLALPGGTKTDIIPDNPLIYEHIVGRILDAKCVKCHNPNKTKGEFLMTSFEALLKGGESGANIIPGGPDESEFISRLELPIEDEDHMPPEGETPLDAGEIEIMKRWIALGASDTLRLNHLESKDPLAILIKEMMVPDPLEKWAQLPGVQDSTLTRLASDYLTITRIAASSNALRIAMYKPPKYDITTLTRLKVISENIVELDLSGLPIGKDEMHMIAGCKNLEWLEINNTPITDNDLDTLKVLSNLKLLKVFETDIADNSLDILKNIKSLEQLYIWETSVTEPGILQLKKDRPDLEIFSGINSELKTFFAENDTLAIKEKTK